MHHAASPLVDDLGDTRLHPERAAAPVNHLNIEVQAAIPRVNVEGFRNLVRRLDLDQLSRLQVKRLLRSLGFGWYGERRKVLAAPPSLKGVNTGATENECCLSQSDIARGYVAHVLAGIPPGQRLGESRDLRRLARVDEAGLCGIRAASGALELVESLRRNGWWCHGRAGWPGIGARDPLEPRLFPEDQARSLAATMTATVATRSKVNGVFHAPSTRACCGVTRLMSALVHTESLPDK